MHNHVLSIHLNFHLIEGHYIFVFQVTRIRLIFIEVSQHMLKFTMLKFTFLLSFFINLVDMSDTVHLRLDVKMIGSQLHSRFN